MSQTTASLEISRERPSIEELYSRAEDLVPVLKERAERAEKLRRVPDESIDDLEKAGLFYIVAPTDRGGYGYGLLELGEVTRLLAHGCASTAWIYHFLTLYNLQITQDTPQLLRGRPFVRSALSAGAHLAPSGTAVPVRGGWQVSGRWPYASAILHAEYIMLVTTEPTSEADDGKPKVLGLVCDASQATVLDDWHVSGMAATGSNTFELNDVFVAEDQTWNVWGAADPTEDGRTEEGESPGKFTVIGDFGIMPAGCAIGTVEAAVEEFAVRIHKRMTPLGGGPQREHREAWGRYGRAFTEVRVSRLLYQESLRIVDDLHRRHVKPKREQVAILKTATSRMCKAASDALEIVAEGSGSSVYQLSAPFQRQQRDVAVIKSHALMAPDSAYVSSGQVLLGLGEPSDPMFAL